MYWIVAFITAVPFWPCFFRSQSLVVTIIVLAGCRLLQGSMIDTSGTLLRWTLLSSAGDWIMICVAYFAFQMYWPWNISGLIAGTLALGVLEAAGLSREGRRMPWVFAVAGAHAVAVISFYAIRSYANSLSELEAQITLLKAREWVMGATAAGIRAAATLLILRSRLKGRCHTFGG